MSYRAARLALPLCAALCMTLAGPAGAQDPASEARAALEQLDQASRQLEAAEGARDRVSALTETIRSFESGLGAMREGMRQAATREEQLRRRLGTRDAEIRDLLAALMSFDPDRSPVSFLHPQGPVGAARAGMIVAEMTPSLYSQTTTLRRDLEDVVTLGALQRQAAKHLERGLTELQAARIALSRAMADRTDLPRRFVADPTRAAILLETAETLDAFASGLAKVAVDARDWVPPRLEDRIGVLPLPVRGVVIRAAGEPDAAGITRPGIVLATRRGALVTSPTAATIRYVGPLLDFGNVIILEPRASTLFILSGLDIVYGEAGQVIAEGTPLGLMGGLRPDLAQERVQLDSLGTGSDRRETLYMEVRQENVPMDPEDWFRTREDG